jgi:hypothetical protein
MFALACGTGRKSGFPLTLNSAALLAYFEETQSSVAENFRPF